MKILKFNVKILKTVLIISLGIASTLGMSSLMIHNFTVNYGEILKSIEKNMDVIENKLIDRETSIEDKKELIAATNLYFLSRECMEYYKIESIDNYMILQEKMYKIVDFRENYGRYSEMKEKKLKLKKILDF
ncbi:hypothetical protein NON08_12710 [Cetobacterium somerae]|uniref:hypothetical protein n=1 Tax=Cetobacterium sp. NK01 TaxID=2993530 RepID=UPI002115F53A|nr:hypothetical protein [Cetobacterium sp. NK01]MCQ8213362.1 hypothetical protein [Cetobacterium sp. NK01]